VDTHIRRSGKTGGFRRRHRDDPRSRLSIRRKNEAPSSWKWLFLLSSAFILSFLLHGTWCLFRQAALFSLLLGLAAIVPHLLIAKFFRSRIRKMLKRPSNHRPPSAGRNLPPCDEIEVLSKGIDEIGAV